MFISTPFVLLIVSRLYKVGYISKEQRVHLIKQDRHINIATTVLVAVSSAAIFLP